MVVILSSTSSFPIKVFLPSGSLLIRRFCCSFGVVADTKQFPSVSVEAEDEPKR